MVPVVFCFDANYAPYAAVATFSAAQRATGALKTYWLTPQADQAVAHRYQASLESAGIAVQVVAVDVNVFNAWREYGHIARSAYLRLLVPDNIPEDKIIYLDCDILVRGDLTELYGTPLSGRGIAAVIDALGRKAIELKGPDGYFNSGVLVMDLKKLREEAFLDRCAALYREIEPQILWGDQCVLNKLFDGQYVALNPRWNTQVYANRVDLETWRNRRNADIIHFIGGRKPWDVLAYPWAADHWWAVADQVPNLGLKRTSIHGAREAKRLWLAHDLHERIRERRLPRVAERCVPRFLRGALGRLYHRLPWRHGPER